MEAISKKKSKKNLQKMTNQPVAISKQAARQDLVGMICICDRTMTPIPKAKAKKLSYGYKNYVNFKIRTHDL